MTFRNPLRCFGLFALAGLTALPAAAAEITDKVDIHAYGSWVAGISDPHPYLAGSGENEVEAENVDLSINVSARPLEDIRIVGEIFFAKGAATGELEEEEVELDLAFVEWDVRESVKLQFGRSRVPFGIYGDVIEVGVLRPLFFLPQSIYGDTGFMAEAYDGVGALGQLAAGDGWELRWNLYGGAMTTSLRSGAFAEGEPEGEEGEEAEESDLEKLLGGRLVLQTPLEGLSFGASAYSAEPQESVFSSGTEPEWGDHTVVGVHGEFDRHPWLLRAEGGRHTIVDADIDSFYLEAARFLGERWQLAARYDTTEVDWDTPLPPYFDPLLEHEETAVSLNYWFGRALVLRLGYQRVEGNLLARATTLSLADLVTGSLEDTTDLVTFGAQFAF